MLKVEVRMELTFTRDDARLLFGVLASVVVPFVVSWLGHVQWPPVARFVLAIVVSLVAGLLTEYIAGSFSAGSVVAVGVAVFTAAQAHYATWFQALGLERWLNPPVLGSCINGGLPVAVPAAAAPPSAPAAEPAADLAQATGAGLIAADEAALARWLRQEMLPDAEVRRIAAQLRQLPRQDDAPPQS